MKLAVSSVGPKLDSPVDPRFGRCAYFLFIDSHDLSFEAVDNTNSSLGGGAGIRRLRRHGRRSRATVQRRKASAVELA